MTMILAIALRNIGRNRRRTVLSAITIAAGLVAFILMDSILAGIDRMSIDNVITLSSGALKIQTSRYDAEKSTFPLAYGIDSIAVPLGRALRENKPVTAVTRRTLFLGQVSNYTETVPVAGTVVDPVSDTAVFGLKQYIKGDYFGVDNSREIIMGGQLAADLGLKVGDNVTLYALTKYESRNADQFRIAGVLNTADPVINHAGVFITYEAANDFLDLGNTATELDVAMVRNPNLAAFSRNARDIQASIQGRFPGITVDTFLELGAPVLEITKAKRVSGVVIMLILLVIAVVGIFNTVFMSVYERIREIGVLRAHGMRPGSIQLLFVLEGLITGLLGGLIGLAGGIPLNVYLVNTGIPMEKMVGKIATASYGIAGSVYGQWNPEVIAVSFVLGVVVATLAGVIPARHAGNIKVTEALRFV